MGTKLFAPEIDRFTDNLSMEGIPATPEMRGNLKKLYQVFSVVKPGESDDFRSIWFEVERGPISAFGSYGDLKECGEVESFEEFDQLWKSYYPDENKWYNFATAKYRSEMFFYINSKLLCRIDEDEIPKGNIHQGYRIYNKLIKWLLMRISSEMKNLKKDTNAWNNYISRNLSYHKRIGRIKRREFWEIVDEDTWRLDVNLGTENIEKLKLILKQISDDNQPGLDEMTAGRFYAMCEIAYDANNYFKNETGQLTPKEKYLKMADGRDAGLRDIDEDSPQAFKDWYHSGKTMGAHPWEICRGGNSTHISLFVSDYSGKWKVRLAGSSVVRVEETVRMALALNKNNTPFQLSEAREIYNMVTGNDYIGIVPDYVIPRYCHSFFPPGDNIIDFMNLGFDREIAKKIIGKSFWYPIEPVVLS
ncbi:MAG: hypothetical protein EP310_09300 [Bacteroidetes bacterium]|nr:MAG: hypothetical protein EP310_09300 [Bacteroidota bacterium]